jgi:hypothetical protein
MALHQESLADDMALIVLRQADGHGFMSVSSLQKDKAELDWEMLRFLMKEVTAIFSMAGIKLTFRSGKDGSDIPEEQIAEIDASIEADGTTGDPVRRVLDILQHLLRHDENLAGVRTVVMMSHDIQEELEDGSGESVIALSSRIQVMHNGFGSAADLLTTGIRGLAGALEPADGEHTSFV